MDLSRERQQQIRDYYLRDDIVEEMVRVARDREFAPTYPKGYGRRPDAVNLPGDFRSFVQRGAIAFHGSVERWKNPHLIDEVDDPDDLRTGWDLVIDIDCDHDLAFAKMTAKTLLEELREFGIDHVSVKFSGNRGFHLGVRHEAFPDRLEGEPISSWYPDLPQAIVGFLRSRIRDRLADRFIEHDPAIRDQIYPDDTDEPDPYSLCDVENDWGDRHLFRMPYSVNEKSWLVSLPIDPEAIDDFEKQDAEPDAVTVEHRFLDGYESGEADALAIEALDWYTREHQDQQAGTDFSDTDFERPDEAIPEEHFPPTIKNILAGLEDGRKRAVFILVTFLAHTGYDWDAIEQLLYEWNQRNEEPLDERYIETQLEWHKRQDEPLMPPNWDSRGFYQDLGVYEADSLTENVNNPVSYAFARLSDDEDDEDGDDEDSGVECPYCGKEYSSENKWYRDHVMECDG